MSRCIFENLTPAQAKMMASWYSEQGEQDIGVWSEIHEIPTPYSDKVREEGDDVIVTCHSFE